MATGTAKSPLPKKKYNPSTHLPPLKTVQKSNIGIYTMISQSPVNRREDILSTLTATNLPSTEITTEDPLIDLSDDRSSNIVSDRQTTDNSRSDKTQTRKRKQPDHDNDPGDVTEIKSNIRTILFDDKNKCNKATISALLGEFYKPKIIRFNVNSKLTEQEIIEEIYSKNLSNLPKQDIISNIKLLFKLGPRNKETVHWVLR